MEAAILSQIRQSAELHPNKAAILGIGRQPSTYAGLAAQIDQSIQQLKSLGIDRGDRIALALPNGPESAVCSIATACSAACAPMNPAMPLAEAEVNLRRLHPRALIVEDPFNSPAAKAARALEIPLIRLVNDPDAPAGTFRLEGTRLHRKPAEYSNSGDIAFLVLTSGSTALPKVAPLTHANVVHGVSNNVVQLGLTEHDRCLCVAALFYTQGILVSVLSSLFSGGSVVCTPGYDPARFFEWMDEGRPTWYAAPTAVQQSILAQANQHRDIIGRSRIRVIRCSSSHASADLLRKIEHVFHAPVLDSYGLTETSSTIAGERLPPATRKTGSVGTAVGCEIGIAGESGELLPAGAEGEIVVRGPNVIRAYETDADVNNSCFFGDWLRTGDLGHLDEDGYLFITGRIKEIINRGGEKIAPAEIEDALGMHPEVAEAVAFSIPDKVVGEEIGAALVLRHPKGRGIEGELRSLVAARLGPSRVPRRFFFVDEIPKLATGKVARMGLAEKLGASLDRETDEPMNSAGAHTQVTDSVTTLVLQIWEDVMGRAPIEPHEDFFDLGGDSLVGARILARLQETFGKPLTLANFFEAPTPSRMARLLTQEPAKGFRFTSSQIIPIRASGSLPPLFIVGPNPLFRHLILNLPKELPIYGLTFPDPKTLSVPFQLEEIAELQVAAIRRMCPDGQLSVLGWCADGVLAYEMARRLAKKGAAAPLVVMVDAFNPARLSVSWKSRMNRLGFHLSNLSNLDFDGVLAYARDRLDTIRVRARRHLWRTAYRLRVLTERRLNDQARIPDQILNVAMRNYIPGPYEGRVLLLSAQHRPKGSHIASGWRDIASDLHVADVTGNHTDIFRPGNVESMARFVGEQIREHELREVDACAVRS